MGVVITEVTMAVVMTEVAVVEQVITQASHQAETNQALYHRKIPIPTMRQSHRLFKIVVKDSAAC